MCGILFYVGSKNNRAEFQYGLEAIKHRGPDETNFAEVSSQSSELFDGRFAYLGHTRLNIVDDNFSKQPMTKDKIFLAYNGEIYNFEIIKKELEALGVSFKTYGDTEVLLEAYRIWGVSCVSKFIGMWSFVIIDQNKKQIHVCRDRLGVKPLYYYNCDKTLVVSSEIKAILPFVGDVYANKDEAIRYLIYGAQETSDETFFSEIKRVNAAHWLEFDFNGTLICSQDYYPIAEIHDKSALRQNIPQELNELISEAVGCRISPDKTTAITLSGGVDSNIILSEALKVKKTPTFTAIYDEGPDSLNECELISKVLKNDQIQNKKILCTSSQVLNSIEDIVYIQDEPFDTLGIFAQNFVYKAVSDANIKITLDGQGADELFLGYPNFRPIILFYALLKFDFKYLIGNRSLFNPIVLRNLIALFIPQLFHRAYFNKRSRLLFKRRISWLKSRKSRYFKILNLRRLIESNLRDHLAVLLRYVDRNSMHHSVEARGPFLDYRVLELSLNLEYHHMYNDNLSKKILRDAYRNIVHDDILDNKLKLGFPVPEQKWMKAIKDRYSHDLVKNDLINQLDLRLDDKQLLNWKVYNLYFWIKTFDIKGWK